MPRRKGLFLNAYRLADGRTYFPPGQPPMNHSTATQRGRYIARASAGTVTLAYMVRVYETRESFNARHGCENVVDIRKPMLRKAWLGNGR